MKTETLLETIKESFDLESYQERWIEKGYTIAEAQKAKDAYEEWAQEDIALDAIDDAILGNNLSGGLFPTRLEAFFAGWIANSRVSKNATELRRTETPETDSQEWDWNEDCAPENEMIVPSEFSRGLERARDLLRFEMLNASKMIHKLAKTNEDYIAAAYYKRLSDSSAAVTG